MIRFQEHDGPRDPDERIIQRHHLEKLTPGCALRDCPVRWKDIRR